MFPSKLSVIQAAAAAAAAAAADAALEFVCKQTKKSVYKQFQTSKCSKVFELTSLFTNNFRLQSV